MIAKLYPEAAADTGRREIAALQQLRGVADELHVPKLLFHTRFRNHGLIVVQSAMNGRVLADDLDTRHASALLEQLRLVQPWLEAFHARVSARGTLAQTLLPMLVNCEVSADHASQAHLARALRRHLDVLDRVPAVPVHGDFWAKNILCGVGRIAVIDWDGFAFGALTEDLTNFIAASSYRHHPDAVCSAQRKWEIFFGTSALVTVGKSATEGFLTCRGFGLDLARPLFLAFLLGRLLRTDFIDHAGWQIFVSMYVSAGLPPPFTACPLPKMAVPAQTRP